MTTHVGARADVPRPEAPGFTLIELVVALSVMMLLAATVPVAASKLHESMQYRSTVKELVAALKGARLEAARTGTSVPFALDLAQRSFGVGERRDERIPETLAIRLITAQREIAPTEGVGMIRFFPDGSSTGGTIELRRPSGDGVGLRVDWLLGRISQEVLEGS